MQKHKDSHLDHGLTEAQIAYLLSLEVPAGQVTVQTLELPEALGTVPCGLYGPLVGDEPVPESAVVYAVRGARAGSSRLVERPLRPSRLVTVIAGPHDGLEGVIYTAFGGPAAPKEPFEFEPNPKFTSFGEIQSREFWKEHALSTEGVARVQR